MLPETMQMEFFGEGLKEVTSMDVFYATIVGLIVGAVISSVTRTRLCNKRKRIFRRRNTSRGHVFKHYLKEATSVFKRELTRTQIFLLSKTEV